MSGIRPSPSLRKTPKEIYCSCRRARVQRPPFFRAFLLAFAPCMHACCNRKVPPLDIGKVVVLVISDGMSSADTTSSSLCNSSVSDGSICGGRRNEWGHGGTLKAGQRIHACRQRRGRGRGRGRTALHLLATAPCAVKRRAAKTASTVVMVLLVAVPLRHAAMEAHVEAPNLHIERLEELA